MEKLLIANRGEIAVRIARAAAELGLVTVAVYAEDDAASLHRSRADESEALTGSGPAAYLDIGQMVEVACRSGCDAVHPGYGFLSENPDFAAAVEAAGLTFVGPTPETLALLGDKVSARRLAGTCGVPLLAGSQAPVTLEEARAFLAGLPDGVDMVIKAVAGGGGRGMRVVGSAADREEA